MEAGRLGSQKGSQKVQALSVTGESEFGDGPMAITIDFTMTVVHPGWVAHICVPQRLVSFVVLIFNRSVIRYRFLGRKVEFRAEGSGILRGDRKVQAR